MNGGQRPDGMPVGSLPESVSQNHQKRKNGQNFWNMSAESSSCAVCSAPAVVYKQYGALCCFSCRAFFRRNIQRQFICVLGNGNCTVDQITRNNCRSCRMERCLQSGMKPELVDATVKTKPQKISLCDGSQHALINNKPSNNQLEIGRKDYSEQYPVLNEIVVLNDIQDDNRSINESPQVLATNITNPIRQQKTLESSEVNRNGLDTNIDIEKLVELCYTEEVNTLSCADATNSTSGTIVPFKKRRTDHYNEATMKICNQPLISFTFEEEFRLHDLIVRREYMNEKTHAHMQDIEPTMMKTATERMFADINANRKVTFDEDYLDFYFSASQKIVSVILPEVFDEFKHLKRDIVKK